MKKVYFVLAITLFAFVFASCTKEGAFKPKERISKVFRSSTWSWTYNPAVYESGSDQTSKYLREMWKWGDKTLDQIDYYSSNGTVSYSYNFTYDNKKRIERIDDYKDSYYTTFKYDGKVLKTVETWSNGTIYASANITYEGNAFSGRKIKKIDYTEYDKKKNAKEEYLSNPLRFLLGEEIANNVDVALNKRNATRGVFLVTIDFTWTKNNVSTMKISGNDGGYFEHTYTYTYDSNKNPFYKMYAMLGPDEDAVDCLSENNVTGYTYTYIEDGDTDNGTVNYNLSYDGKYPSMKMYTDTYSYSDVYHEYVGYHWDENLGQYVDEYNDTPYTYTSTSTYTTYYEYE
ncbi:MAG: hypothetical protein IK025_12610 [Bacteroidales bacterium]|nr:hypothetical protein [Bacteroidales bacterium]